MPGFSGKCPDVLENVRIFRKMPGIGSPGVPGPARAAPGGPRGPEGAPGGALGATPIKGGKEAAHAQQPIHCSVLNSPLWHLLCSRPPIKKRFTMVFEL